MAKVLIPQRHMTLDVAPDQALMWELMRCGLPVASSCGGDAVCGKCRVRIVAGAELLSPVGPDEAALIGRLGLAADERISCQVNALERPSSSETSRASEMITLETSYW